VEVVKVIVRVFSYIYHAVLALFLAAVSGLALATAPQSLHLDMLPWTGSTLAYTVFFGSLIGLVTVVLALKKRLRVLFFLWSLVVVVLMLKGFIFSGFRFNPGSGGPRTAAYLMVGSLLALIGAWWQMMGTPGAQRRY
jgi:hypothetical protein